MLLVARGVGEQAAGRVEQALRGEPDVLLGGSPIVARQVDAIVARDLKRAEMIAFPLVFLLSLWVFRGFVAALLPPLVGAIAIAGAFLGLRLAAEATTLSMYALDLVVGMGLGLAINYSLFVVVQPTAPSCFAIDFLLLAIEAPSTMMEDIFFSFFLSSFALSAAIRRLTTSISWS